MSFKSIGEISQKIIEIETNKDLFRWSIKGIKVYQLLRYKIYFKALAAHIDKKNDTKKSSKSILGKIIAHSPQIKNFFFYNPLNDKKQSDVLLFESSRKHLIDDEFVDSFTRSSTNHL